jgi:transposase-like protein
MRNNNKKVTLCLDLFFNGISTRKIQSHLHSFYPHNSSHMTIYRWIVKYSNLISTFTNELKIKVGKEIQVDEMEYSVNKKKAFFIDSIDTETRFMVASEFVRGRSTDDLKQVIARAKQKTGEQIKICTTDGYFAYQKAVKSIFRYSNKTHSYEAKHNIVTQLKNEGFNHKVERMHSNIRARTKTFRGFGSIDGANAIMKGYETYYNFIRKHQAINCCPYELACPELKEELNVPNKWLALIQLAIQNNLK